MSIRSKPIYVTNEVWSALWLLGKATPSKSSEIHTATPDEIADGMLHDVINERFPQLFEHQKKREKAEKEIIESLKQ